MDANRCALLPERTSDVYEIIRRENANLMTCSALILLLCTASNDLDRCLLGPPFRTLIGKGGKLYKSDVRAIAITMT